MSPHRFISCLTVSWPWWRCVLAALLAACTTLAAAAADELPQRLSGTGLHAVDGKLRRGVASYTPQYPLWSDGAGKRRWIWLPAGARIDAAKPDAWQFPRGTKLWKEFAVDGQPVETRYIERRADGSWHFASYIWNADGSDATLAPERGATLAVPGAPDGRYVVPGRGDCLACHRGAVVPVLGFSALQLSPDSDPLAPHAQPPRPDDVNLNDVARRWLRGFPAALGYLHANCGHCHHGADGSEGGVPVALTLAQRVPAPAASREATLRSAIEAASRYRPAGAGADVQVIAPGAPQTSLLVARMRSRRPLLQMPPLGTRQADGEALSLIENWIAHDLSSPKGIPK